jgi:hypothetical protein
MTEPHLPPLRGLDEHAGDVEGAGYGPRARNRRRAPIDHGIMISIVIVTVAVFAVAAGVAAAIIAGVL